jgi:hypothetical protein
VIVVAALGGKADMTAAASAAASDPSRQFGTANYRIAKGRLLDNIALVGRWPRKSQLQKLVFQCRLEVATGSHHQMACSKNRQRLDPTPQGELCRRERP